MKTTAASPPTPPPIDEIELRILRASADRFMSQGYSKVTLDEVAADLRMSKKTMYKFFPAKEMLLRSIVRMIIDRMEGRLNEIVESNQPSTEKFLALFMLVGGQARRLTRQFQLDIQRFAPSAWTEIDTFRRERVFPKVSMIFRQARDEGMFKADIPPELFYLIFVNTVQSIANPQVLSQQSFSAEEAFRGILRILFTGVLTDEAQETFERLIATLGSQQNTELI